MKPRPFCYHAPRTLETALALLAEHGDEAKVLAGGQSLIPMLNFRLASPAHLVDITRVAGLDHLKLEANEFRLGATLRQRALETAPDAAVSFPIVPEALRHVAHFQIRNRGTIGGSLAHADAAAELPAVMVALGAQMRVASLRATRMVAAREFFRFHLATILEADELLVEVVLPLQAVSTEGTFVEVARHTGDFALVGSAVQTAFGDSGRVSDCQIVCCGVAPVPFELPEAATICIGSDLSDPVLAEVEQAVRMGLDPPSDIHASGSYRRQVGGALVRRALAAIRSRRDSHGS